MSEKNPATLLKQLENTLRADNEKSGWLYLEPIDNELLESIQHALDHQEIERETQPEQTPQKSVLHTTTRISDIAVPVKNSTTTEPTPATNQSATSEPLNMDPMLAKTLDSLRLRLRNCNRCNLCNER